MRTIGVVTGARSDYGIYLPLLKKIESSPDLQLHLIVAGMHLSPEFGLTKDIIKQDGFEIKENVEMLLSSDTPDGIAKSIGIGVISFAQAFSRYRPDILVVLGDRFEMYSAALAALPFKIPLAHIHGGEVTRGAIDDALRHSITKLSHLHFVSTEEYGRRVIQLGEEPWRVIISGAPSLDNIESVKLIGIDEIEEKYGFRLKSSPLLVTFHPVTLEFERAKWQISQLLSALDNFEKPVVFTMPNADTSGRVIKRMIEEYVRSRSSAYVVDNFGTCDYFSMLAVSAAMIGNSSSGIIEAASFELPVVNIGTRQDGRIKGINVIDTGYRANEIEDGIRLTLTRSFRSKLRGTKNLYGNGKASQRIISSLKAVDTKTIVFKRFYKNDD